MNWTFVYVKAEVKIGTFWYSVNVTSEMVR
jgi:hypothetical protein